MVMVNPLRPKSITQFFVLWLPLQILFYTKHFLPNYKLIFDVYHVYMLNLSNEYVS